MSIHLFLDPLLEEQVSENGDFTNPDSDTFNGTDGESKDRELYLANERGSLKWPMTDFQDYLELNEPRFSDGEVIAIDSEQMRINAGGGSDLLHVERGVNGTARESHEAGALVYSGYNYTNLVIQPHDIDSTSSETWWIRLAQTQEDLDVAEEGEALNLGSKAYDETKTFWRRITVPENTPVQNKLDLRLRIVGIETPITD